MADHMPFVKDDGGRAAAGFKGSTGDCVTRAVCIASGLLLRRGLRGAFGLQNAAQDAPPEAQSVGSQRRKHSPEVVQGLHDGERLPLGSDDADRPRLQSSSGMRANCRWGVSSFKSPSTTPP